MFGLDSVSPFTFHRIAHVHTQRAFAQAGIVLSVSATLQISGNTNFSTCRATGAAPSSTLLLNALDKLESCLHAFLGCHDAEGVQSAARLVWNAGLPLLDQKRSKQLKRTFTSAAQALAAVASPLHRLRSACSNDSCPAVSASRQVCQEILSDHDVNSFTKGMYQKRSSTSAVFGLLS